MGCRASKSGNKKAEAETQMSPPQPRKLPWAPEATQWRWLLRTTQSLVAACLYIASTWVRAPSLPVLLQLLLALFLAPPFTLAYHLLSLNQAGGYYDTYLEMFVELPQHIRDTQRRDSAEYHAEIENERRDGIVRTVNGLETGMVFLVVAWFGALCSGFRHGADFASDFIWRCVETCVFLVLHRFIGANVFEGRHWGLFQPESMWYFECFLTDTSGVDVKIMPLGQHPDPSY